MEQPNNGAKRNKTPRGSRKWNVPFFGSSGRLEKWNTAQAVRKSKKAGKKELEQMGLNDKTVQRLREYLLAKGWTAEEILDLFDYITK